MTDDIRLAEALKALDEQEAKLTAAADDIGLRLAQVRAAREALLPLTNEEPTEFDGKLIDASRRVVRDASPKSLSPTEVRDRVKALGYDFSKHPNEMAAVHGVLKRLVEKGEAKTKTWKKQPGTRYYWCGPLEASVSEKVAVADVPIGWMNDGSDAAVRAQYAHRQRTHHAAISQTTSNPALHTNFKDARVNKLKEGK